jgi:hypothetical protein
VVKNSPERLIVASMCSSPLISESSFSLHGSSNKQELCSEFNVSNLIICSRRALPDNQVLTDTY